MKHSAFVRDPSLSVATGTNLANPTLIYGPTTGSMLMDHTCSVSDVHKFQPHTPARR